MDSAKTLAIARAGIWKVRNHLRQIVRKLREAMRQANLIAAREATTLAARPRHCGPVPCRRPCRMSARECQPAFCHAPGPVAPLAGRHRTAPRACDFPMCGELSVTRPQAADTTRGSEIAIDSRQVR